MQADPASQSTLIHFCLQDEGAFLNEAFPPYFSAQGAYTAADALTVQGRGEHCRAVNDVVEFCRGKVM